MALKKNIILFLSFIYAPTSIHAQFNRSFYLNSDSCTSKFYFDSSGVFFSAKGCKGIFTVSYGTYKLTRDQIIVEPRSFNSLTPYQMYYEDTATNDTAIKVTFLARYKKTIPDKTFAIDAIDSLGKFYKRLLPDNKGSVLINPKQYKSLRINYLDHYYTKWVEIPMKNTDMTVELSLPREFFQPHHPQIEISGIQVFKIKKDGLYNNTGARIGNPEE